MTLKYAQIGTANLKIPMQPDDMLLIVHKMDVVIMLPQQQSVADHTLLSAETLLRQKNSMPCDDGETSNISVYLYKNNDEPLDWSNELTSDLYQFLNATVSCARCKLKECKMLKDLNISAQFTVAHDHLNVFNDWMNRILSEEQHAKFFTEPTVILPNTEGSVPSDDLDDPTTTHNPYHIPAMIANVLVMALSGKWWHADHVYCIIWWTYGSVSIGHCWHLYIMSCNSFIADECACSVSTLHR
jgi:hypothetical protein